MMKDKHELWSNISFKTQSFRKSYDMVCDNEHIITLNDGTIKKMRIETQQPPTIIGEYGFSIWDMRTANMFDVDVKKLVKDYAVEDTYKELLHVINEGDLDLDEFMAYDKVVLIHTLILQPEYRNMGVAEEFIEMIHREYWGMNVAIIALVKPFQDNMTDADYFLNRRFVEINDNIKLPSKFVTALEHYDLKVLIENEDTEANELRLFAVAARCGFRRIGESHLFIYTPTKTIKRMKSKFDSGVYDNKIIENYDT